MDATQVINDSILESDEEEKNEEEKPNSGQKPLAKLRILKNDHIPERDFPLFVGDNVLGRDPSTCTLPLPAPSVSKQHATISIHVHRRRESHSGVDMEALVWDLGSMNGTRKGRLKLTPNVRYSLSEGDCLVMADIPCQYIRREHVGTPESRTAGVNVRFPGASIEKRVKVRASGSTHASGVPSLLGEAKSFETTPVQPQRMLVPESDSDSDGEIRGHREDRCKVLDSDSSAAYSTFLSPTSNIVPESEDESPITPSSSTREKPHRYVSFSKEPDINAGRQQSPATVDDIDEGEGAVVNGQTPGGMRFEEKKHGVLEQSQSKASFIGAEGLPQVSTSTVIPDFNMDSDTDMEAEEEGEVQAVQFHMDSDTDVEADEARPLEGTYGDVSHDAPKAGLVPPVMLDDFQLDSDTDVDEGPDNTSRDETPSRLDLKMGDLSESDDDQGPAFNTHPDVRGSNYNNVPVAVIPADITIAASESDADTDVDEFSAPSAGGGRGQDSKTNMEDQMPSLPVIKPSGLHAALLHNCSTPVQERDVADMETQAFLSPSQDSCKRAVRPTALSPCSDSPEDEDFVVAETQPFIIQARRQVQGGLHDASQASEHNSSGEDKEESFQLGLSDSSHLQSHAHALAVESTQAFVPVSVADTQAYATPGRTSHGDDLNMEATQAYEEPSKSPVRQVELALQETQAYISEGYSESDDDPEEETQPLDLPTSSPTLAVAETQPALREEPTTNNKVACLQTQGQIPKEVDLKEEHTEVVVETRDETRPIPKTQLVSISEDEVSNPVLRKGKAEQLLLEGETQPLMSDDFSAETQPIGQTQPIPTSLTEESDGEDPRPGLVQLQKEKKSTTSLAVDTQPVNVAVTQLAATSDDDDESDGEDLIPVLRNKRKARPLEETQSLSSCDLPVAETQPTGTSHNEESDDEDPLPVSHKMKVQPQKQTRPITSSNDAAVEVQPITVAATQPMATSVNDESDDEDSIPVSYNNRKAKPLQLEDETQPLMSGDFSAAETQPMDIGLTQPIPTSLTEESDGEDPCSGLVQLQKEKKSTPSLAVDTHPLNVAVIQPIAISDDDESDGENSIPVLRNKRKARPLEETQPLSSCDLPVAETQPVGTSHNEESDDEDPLPVSHKMKVQPQKQARHIPSSNDAAVEVQPITVAATQPMATSVNDESDDDDSIPVSYNNRKAKPLQLEEERQPLKSGDFSAADTLPMDIGQTQPIPTSLTEEIDSEAPIPGLVQSRKEKQFIPNLAVDTHPFNVAVNQPMAISDDEESARDDSIPVLHNRRKAGPLEETQPLTSCDFPITETQPTAARHTEESDDEDPVPASHETKVQLQKVLQPVTSSNGAAVELQHMTVAATQPMAISDNDESDDEDSVPVWHSKRKAKPLQLEEETQPLTGYDIPITETPLIATSHTDGSAREGLIPVLVQLQKETQSIMCSDSSAVEVHPMTVAATQPMAFSENECSDSKDSIPVSDNKRKERSLQLEEETQPLISCDLPVAETPRTASSQSKGSDGEDLIPALPRGEIQLQKEMRPTSSLNVAVTQPLATSENEDSDDEDSVPVLSSNRKAKRLQEESLSSTVELLPDILNPKSKPEDGDKGQRSSHEDTSVSPRKPQEEAPQPLEISALGDGLDPGRVEEEPVNSKERATQPLDTSEDEQLDSEILIPGPQRRKVKPLQFEDETQSLMSSPSSPQLQNGTKDDVGTSSTNVGHSKRTQEKEETEKRQTGSTKARGKTIKSRPVKESKEKTTWQQTKDQQQNIREHQSIQIELLESKKNEDEIRETERKEREERERLQKEIAECEKREERLEAAKEQERCKRERTELEMATKERLTQSEEEEKPKAPPRGRKSTRRTIAALTAAEQDLDDVPAKRTRSRSNSSNSISSEVSTASTQGSRGTGQGEKRLNGPAQAPSTRRRTVAVEPSGLREPPEKDIGGVSPMGVLSRSSSSTSLASEMSCSSLGSRGRGRGGRQQGIRGKSETGPSSVQPVLSQNPAPKPKPRGRRGRKADVSPSEDDEDDEEKPEVKQAPSTRGRKRASVKEPRAAEQSNQGNQSAGEDSSLPKRTFRGQTVKSEAVGEPVALLSNNQQEAKEDKRKGRKRQLEAVGEEAKDDTLAPVQAKRRGRIAQQSPRDTSSEDGSVPSASGAAEPQTPISSKTRKRKASVQSSPGTPCTSSQSLSRGPRTDGQFYKVLFTGVVDEAGEKVLARLGGALANGAADMNCLVTDKVRRTVKFLCAVAKGVPIVTTQWLEMSGKAGSLLPPEGFIVQDPEQEKKFSFCLQESLRLASSQPLLQGYEIHITKAVKPEPVHMKDIITCSGATFLPKMPSSRKPKTVVVSCEEDWPLCRAAILASFPVVSAEFILSGILQHKLDFDTHKLSGPLDNLQPATGRRGRGRKKT
ncbi:mediator of DNA damage checkpoint protein 1 [Dunckerocampus dactyliophorus]|uniref:mediator of DNA damage checkpoint protein 1 n=1 Tax=Dunckerocampus dactyliophorus TaxID=161453 RepID=UPI0024050FFE|nr:mediator of DNA damage checkpoint protein 1 [Dunckerocampus dactyliophorus]